MTYWDHRNSITTAYANNDVNEYTSIAEVDVHYDAAGNLSRDENDYEYGYDYENRLTKVTYEVGGSTQVAAFEYDALGRMISSRGCPVLSVGKAGGPMHRQAGFLGLLVLPAATLVAQSLLGPLRPE